MSTAVCALEVQLRVKYAAEQLKKIILKISTVAVDNINLLRSSHDNVQRSSSLRVL